MGIAPIELSLLGASQITVSGNRLDIPARPMSVLARLAIAAPHSLNAERLAVDLSTGPISDRKPGSGSIRVAVRRLRALIADDIVITRADGSYQLGAVRLDIDEWERLLRLGRRGDLHHADRVDAYLLAFGLWRGTALEDFGDDHWALATASRLNESRQQAIDELASLHLLAGELTEAINLLSPAHRAWPTREARSASLAVALYRAGRQADALSTISRTRQVLREEHGLQPGAALIDTEQRILNHDPELRQQVAVGDLGAVTAALRSAEVMIQSGVFDTAQSLIERAQVLAGGTDDETLQARINLTRARLAMTVGQADPHQLIDEAIDIARRLGDPKLLAQAAMTRFGAGVPNDDPLAAIIELTEPLALLPKDDPDRIDLLCAAAGIALYSGLVDASAGLLEQAEQLHAEVGSERSEAILSTLKALAAPVGSVAFATAVVAARRAVEIARRINDVTLEVAALQAIVRAEYADGNLVEIDRLIPELADVGRRAAAPYCIIRAEDCATTNAIARGLWGEAEEHLARVDELTVETGGVSGAGMADVQRLVIGRERDDTAMLRAASAAHGNAPSVLLVVGALSGDRDKLDALRAYLPAAPAGAQPPVFYALVGDVARAENDAGLGRCAAAYLDTLGEHTIMTGISSGLIGFAAHFAGMAWLAAGDAGAAIDRLTRSRQLAGASGAVTWWADSTVELIGALHAAGRHDEARKLDAELVDHVLTARMARRRDEIGDAQSAA